MTDVVIKWDSRTALQYGTAIEGYKSVLSEHPNAQNKSLWEIFDLMQADILEAIVDQVPPDEIERITSE